MGCEQEINTLVPELVVRAGQRHVFRGSVKLKEAVKRSPAKDGSAYGDRLECLSVGNERLLAKESR